MSTMSQINQQRNIVRRQDSLWRLPRRKEWMTLAMPFVFTFFALLVINTQSNEPYFFKPSNEWSMDDVTEAKVVHTGQSLVQRHSNQFSHEYGYCMCVGEASAMVSDAIFTIQRFRSHWKSSYQIMIAHCSELSNKLQNELHKAHDDAVRDSHILDNNGNEPVLAIVDLCKGAPPAKKKRLRSFFCKTAALVMSSARNTMLVDTDLVWFENPDNLFKSPGYVKTGALFFRDRHYIAREEGVELPLDRGLQYEPVVKLMNMQRESSSTHNSDPVININNKQKEIEQGKILANNNNNGNNYFWKCSYDKTSCLGLVHNQDSSVVMIDKQRNHRTIAELRRLIPTFGQGYGDKEIYWISAVIADDAHSWEPYLLGNYGPCGDMMHFNPDVTLNDNNNNNNDIIPYFMNGQFIVEGVHYVGEGMKDRYPSAQVADLQDQPTCHCSEDNDESKCVKSSSKMQNFIRLQQEFMLNRTGQPPSPFQNQLKRLIKRICNKIIPSWLN